MLRNLAAQKEQQQAQHHGQISVPGAELVYDKLRILNGAQPWPWYHPATGAASHLAGMGPGGSPAAAGLAVAAAAATGGLVSTPGSVGAAGLGSMCNGMNGSSDAGKKSESASFSFHSFSFLFSVVI